MVCNIIQGNDSTRLQNITRRLFHTEQTPTPRIKVDDFSRMKTYIGGKSGLSQKSVESFAKEMKRAGVACENPRKLLTQRDESMGTLISTMSREFEFGSKKTRSHSRAWMIWFDVRTDGAATCSWTPSLDLITGKRPPQNDSSVH